MNAEVALETITVQAVYEKGVLKPRKKLDLPEHSVVEIQIDAAQPASKTGQASLFGAFPELKAVTDQELKSVKKSWDRGAKKQSRLLKKVRK